MDKLTDTTRCLTICDIEAYKFELEVEGERGDLGDCTSGGAGFTSLTTMVGVILGCMHGRMNSSNAGGMVLY